MFQQLLKSIEQFGTFSESDQNLLTDLLIKRDFSKGDFVLRQGNTCRSAFFVNKGSLRHFRDVDGYTELTVNLFIEYDWVLDHKSFTGQVKSSNHIRVFEDCELLELTIDAMHKLIALSPSFFRLGKILDPPRNESDIQLLTPEERYSNLINEAPQLIQRFPLKYIASYLNMTPETLSRVRAKTKF